MSRFLIHSIFAATILFAILFAGQFPVHTSASFETKVRSLAAHKVIVYEYNPEERERILAEGGSVIEEYGGFTLMSAPAATADRLSLASASGYLIRDDLNLILLRAGAFDTTQGEPLALRHPGEAEPGDEQLYLVQMVGPVKQEWLDELQKTTEVISYIPNNAYLVRADHNQLGRINDLRNSPGSFIQWAGAYKPGYKIAPEISTDSDQEVVVTVQFAGDEASSDLQKLTARSAAVVVGTPTTVLNYTNVRIKVRADRLAELARNNNVIWIEPWSAPQLFDERQNQIVAGNITGNQLAAPGYINWLSSKGLASSPEFIVDVADSGIDQGSLDPDILHPDLLNAAGLSRVLYAKNFTNSGGDGPLNDTSGHGTINAAILGGYNTRIGLPFLDNQGYSLGLGVHPFVKIGVSKVFNPEWTFPDFAVMAESMYFEGARISNNSWGSYSNNYTIDSQIYDSLVRDASRSQAGNQELTVIFAAGNQGADNLSSPGTAKNVLTVGASENLRPGEDGCGIVSVGADDAYSIISFSSGGRTTDGRLKPEIAAPGTHIQGARSQDLNYDGAGVCTRNYPAGQSFYTWSSGTSHAAPAVAGAAALLRQFFQQSTGKAPSPAMVKAFLTNTTTYMDGALAGDSLPGKQQGWGLINVGRALDETNRLLIDQDQKMSASGQIVTVRGRVDDSSKPFRVTLAWTDAPGLPAANPVVNNLDLQVDIGGRTYTGNSFNGSRSFDGGSPDALNNVESVWIPEGVTGDFVVRVVGANIAGDGVPGNTDTTDQDFALVVYNALPPPGGGGGGVGGGDPIDVPPTVVLTSPIGGEKLIVGDLIRIAWDASDDKQIQSQRVEFTSDGLSYTTLAIVDGSARNFDWRIPALPTLLGRIKLTVLDGVNLPVSSISPGSFEIVQGPPDISPPTVSLVSPSKEVVLGGGTTVTVAWRETDNVGVIQRVIELSTDGGDTFQQIVSLIAPSGAEQQFYQWQVPAALGTDKGKVRITVFDGGNNAATVTSAGQIQVWPMPIITSVDFDVQKGKGQLEIFGRNFRIDETEIYVDGRKLRKARFTEQCEPSKGVCRKVSSDDKKVKKYVPENKFVKIAIKLPKTGQLSPEFSYKRPKR